MLDRCEMRKEAYRYICENLARILPLGAANDGSIISLDELSLLKAGKADPSPEMVTLIKRWFGPAGEGEIDAHLVAPFRQES